MKVLQKIILSSLFLLSLCFGGASRAVENELIIRFDEGLSRTDIELILIDQPLVIVRQISRPLNIWLLRVDPEKIQTRLARKVLEDIPEVRYAQYDHYLSQRLEPDDPDYNRQWGFHNTGYDTSGTPWGIEDADIDAPEAWEISTGGSTVLGREIVAGIVDGGCDMSHPDLLANLWFNSGEIPGDSVDNDKNGWIDDSQGWNAYDHNGVIPTDSHGSFVAGIVGAHSNNANQVAGVNWALKMMIVAGESQTTSIVIEAYSYILEQKLAWLESGGSRGAFIVVVNSSFGVDYADCESGNYPIWNDMYDAMGEAGILSVVATTNSNTDVDQYGDVPTTCSSPYLITVTNTTQYDTKSTAGYGAESIDLGAPGMLILSTNFYQGTTIKSGTSMAAPYVTGAVALMHAAANQDLARYYEEQPARAAQIFKSMILLSVDPLTALENITVSGGRLNLHQAVLKAASWLQTGDGDMNQDEQVNIQDVIILVNLILGNMETTPELLTAGDLDYDELLSIQDLVYLTDLILQ